MIPKPTLFFRLAFSVVTLLELIGETIGYRGLLYSCKPLIIGLLFLYVWQGYPSVVHPRPLRWLLIGMAFALAGDIFLMIQEVDLFAAGLGAFLLMQLCYSVAFWKSIRQNRQPLTERRLGLPAVGFGLYLGIFLIVLRPAFIKSPALLMLWWPVVLYAICLNTMGLLATQRRGLPFNGQVAIGALLFIFSDSVIAVNKFLYPFAGSSWLIMSTYAAAQYLIISGMVQALSTPQESGLPTG